MRGAFIKGNEISSSTFSGFSQTVNTFAELASGTAEGQIALVKLASGTIWTLSRKSAGFYSWQNNAWVFLGNRQLTVDWANVLNKPDTYSSDLLPTAELTSIESGHIYLGWTIDDTWLIRRFLLADTSHVDYIKSNNTSKTTLAAAWASRTTLV